MEMFIALLVIAIIVGVVIFISAREPGDLHLNIQGSPARITLDEAKQVNRVTYLQLISPELARALAGKLQGDAWQPRRTLFANLVRSYGPHLPGVSR